MNEVTLWVLALAAVAAGIYFFQRKARAQREARVEAARRAAERESAELAAQQEAERSAAEATARVAAEFKAARAARVAAQLEAAEREAAQRAAAEATRLEAERQATEAARIAAEGEAAAEVARLEAERQAAARIAAQREAAERETARLESERQSAEAARIAAQRAATQRAATQREAQEREAAAQAARQEAERLSQALAAPEPQVQRVPKASEQTIVMIADDSKVVRVKTGRLLNKNLYQVVSAEDGADAARQIDAKAPDLLITDVEMPGLDGFELTRHVRHNPRTAHLPIIMISGKGDEIADIAREAGVDVVLDKPYDDAALIAHIQRLTE
jgi:CheY-like chemotaxis protein